ncbi:hypothetical protein ACFWC5_33590 [Streptomyces sp. NPDC060085]|uniref:hypothetical protein n=1 Tax=Streptomyces sp. NPDC060085 TaxID=3347054 RepID=UPI003652C027
MSAHLRTAVGTDSNTGKPTLDRSFDEEAIAAERAVDGWYALLTNLPAGQASAEQVFPLRGPHEVERRYSKPTVRSRLLRCSSTTTGASPH